MCLRLEREILGIVRAFVGSTSLYLQFHVTLYKYEAFSIKVKAKPG